MNLSAEQAIKLWHAITHEKTVAATTDSGYECFSEPTPATSILNFLNVKTVIKFDSKMNTWVYEDRQEVAKFLRAMAYALENP